MDKDNINGYDSTLPVNANPIKIDVTGIWVYNVLFASCVDCLKPANYQKGKETFNGSNNSSIQTNIAGGKTTLVYIKYIKKPTPPTPTSTPTPLGAPTNFKATTFCNGTISSLKLSWNAVTHATGYSYWYDDINGNDRGRDIKGTSVTIPFPDVSLSHAYIPEGKQVDLAVEALGNGPASNPVHILSPVTKKCASTK
jgi:hypothetical protein